MESTKTIVLTQADVRSLAEMASAVTAIEGAFAAHGRNETQMPVKVYLDLPQFDGDFRAMPAYFGDSAGVKWVNAHPRNPERHGLPSVLGMYILSDPATALPLAVMDATLLTAIRTGAAAAVASKYLARPDSRSVGFVGSGVQAGTLLSALRVVFDRGPIPTPSGTMAAGLLLASTDPVAADAVALEAINQARRAEGLAFIREPAAGEARLAFLEDAHRKGLGVALRRGIEVASRSV